MTAEVTRQPVDDLGQWLAHSPTVKDLANGANAMGDAWLSAPNHKVSYLSERQGWQTSHAMGVYSCDWRGVKRSRGRPGGGGRVSLHLGRVGGSTRT